MLKIPTTDLIALLDRVLTKHQLTQVELANKMSITPETISRWRAGIGIRKSQYDMLLSMDVPHVKGAAFEYPFSLRIPKSSLLITTDPNGDILISGILMADLNKEKT